MRPICKKEFFDSSCSSHCWNVLHGGASSDFIFQLSLEALLNLSGFIDRVISENIPGHR